MGQKQTEGMDKELVRQRLGGGDGGSGLGVRTRYGRWKGRNKKTDDGRLAGRSSFPPARLGGPCLPGGDIFYFLLFSSYRFHLPSFVCPPPDGRPLCQDGGAHALKTNAPSNHHHGFSSSDTSM